MNAQPEEIAYGNDIWSRSSGQQPYDYALRYAWLSMIQEQYGEDANFMRFFESPPDNMFVESESSKPVLGKFMISGHLDVAQRLFFAATASLQWLHDHKGGYAYYHTQTAVTLTGDPMSEGDIYEDNFSVVVFNSSCTHSSHFQSVDAHGANALAQSGFALSDHNSGSFRDAVSLGKLADHPLLKHYRF